MTSEQAPPAADPGPVAYRPPRPDVPAVPRRPRVTAWVLRVAIVVLFAICGLLTVAAISTATGVAGLVVGLALAVVPVFPVAAAFLWLDRYEAEPPSLLLFAFGWGAAVATLVSLILNTASTEAITASGGDPTLAAVLVAPVVEETMKGLAVVAVLLLRRRGFDGVVDGIVYAGLAGIGFAFVENVLYLGRAFLEGGSAEAVAVFVLRCVVSPFAHPLFTIPIGIGIGVAVSRGSGGLRFLAPLAGWVVAVVLHATWNLATITSLQGFVAGYVLVQVPIFLGVVALAVTARRREGRLVRRHLSTYAASGWLTTAEVQMLASLPERGAARSWAQRTSGPDAKRAMRDFQELATELAFLRERIDHGTAPPDSGAAEVRMLQTMWHLRSRFLPRPLGAVA